MVSKFKNIKFGQILPSDSQSIEQVIDTRCVFRTEKKKGFIKKIVFPYDHLVSVTLKYHRRNLFLIRYITNEPPHNGHLGDRSEESGRRTFDR